MIRFLTGLSLGNVLTGLLGALLLGSILTNCNTDRKLQAERLAHQTTQAQHAEQVAAAEKLRADEEAKRRKAEQELTHAQEAHGKEIAAIQVDLDRARDRAALESGRVRDAAASAAARARTQCPNPAAPNLGASTGDPIGVLGRVLAEIDDYAGVVAEFADRSRIAGLACETRYDEAFSKLKDGQ